MSQKHEAWVEGMSGSYLLSTGAYVADATHPLLDWITLDLNAVITVLKEPVEGGFKDVLGEFGLTTGVAIPTDFNFTLKSTRGNGFSHITLTTGKGQAFRVQPLIP